MTALIPFPPLALDRSGTPFHPPEGTAKWLVRKYETGRPGVVRRKRNGEPVKLPLMASFADFEEAVDWAPGQYRAYPMGDDDQELDGKVAYIFIERSSEAPTVSHSEVLERVIAMHERALEIQKEERNAQSVVMADTIRNMCEANTRMQESASALLTAAAEMARAPRLFDSSVFDELLSRMQASTPDVEQPWYASVLNGPMGQMLAQVLMVLAQQAMRAQPQPAE